MVEIVATSVGSFEVGWGIGTDGSRWLEVDPDAGAADNPWIEEVASAEDVSLFFQERGLPHEEAEALAARLWRARWPEQDG